MNPNQISQIDAGLSDLRANQSTYQFVNLPKAIAQSSILGGWIHNDDDRFEG